MQENIIPQKTTPFRLRLNHEPVAILTTPNTSCLAAHNGLLYSGSTNQIAVFDLTNNNFTQIDTLHTNDAASGSVKSIAFSPSSKIFTAHQDCKIRVWKITRSKRHRLVATLPTVKDRLSRFFSPGNYVRVRRHHKRLWIEHWDAVSGVVVDGGFVYSVSWDRSFKVWSASSDHKCLSSVNAAHHDAINAIAVGRNGVVYTGSADGVIGVWEREGKKKKHTLVRTLVKHKSTVNAMAINKEGSVMFSGSSDRSIMVWKKDEVGNKIAFVKTLWGHEGAVLCLYTIGDSSLVSGSEDRTIRIWRGDVTNGYHCMVVIEGEKHRSPVKSLVVVGVGERSLICSASLDGEIKAFDVSFINSLG